MSVALGAFHWSPESFWNSTPRDLFKAINGHNMMNGEEQGPTAPTREEYEQLKKDIAKRKLENAVHS